MWDNILVYTYVPGTTITVLCKGLIMASFDWLLILLMYYTQYYTGMFKGIVGVKVFMIAYSLLETVAFLINTWTRWIFDITYISDDQIIVQFAKVMFWAGYIMYLLMALCCCLF